MPDPTTESRFRGLVLSAADLKNLNPDWKDPMVEDYLNILDNLITLATLLDIEIDQTLEEIPTNFTNGSIPFVKDGFLVEENINLSYDEADKSLTIGGDIKGPHRAKMYFFAGF